MSRRACRTFLLFALLAVVPARAGAEGEPAGEKKKAVGDEILFSAQSLDRRPAERIIVGEGAVEIVTRDLRLTADRVVYHEESRDVVAEGHVLLDSGTDRLQGEHLELNIDSRVGFLERGEGFVQTYYFTGERIEKLGPDRYFIRNGTFTTCEGTVPDWSFHSTSTTITVDEYLHAWNPSMWIKRVPLLYLPYAVFPIKRERSTGLLIPEVRYRRADGLVVRNHFYWAPRDDFDATLNADYFQKTGWGAGGEVRYLLGPQSHGELNGYFTRNPDTSAERWILSADVIHELPLGIRGRAEVLVQNDRQDIQTIGNTLEQSSSERTTSSFYLSRSWSAYNFALTGRSEESLLTLRSTTLTRFPELSIDRTSTRLFGSNLFLKIAANGVRLHKESEVTSVSSTDPAETTVTTTEFSTTRLHLAPELTWPISLKGVVSLLPAAGYAVTYYSEDLEEEAVTRRLPFYRLGLEGPKVFRVFELEPGGATEKLKHLIEPRISFIYTPEVDQTTLPQFDSTDTIAPEKRLEYSLTNSLFAKVRPEALPAAKPEAGAAEGQSRAPVPAATAKTPADGAPGSAPGAPGGVAPPTRTEELLYLKLSQSCYFNEAEIDLTGHRLSPVAWDARARPLPLLEVSWKGDFSVYGEGVGYQNVSATVKPWDLASITGEWRTARASSQDFLDLALTLPLRKLNLEGRTRYNLEERTFVENRVVIKLLSPCWDLAVGYVKWPEDYEYTVQLSLKGIGTILKI